MRAMLLNGSAVTTMDVPSGKKKHMDDRMISVSDREEKEEREGKGGKCSERFGNVVCKA